MKSPILAFVIAISVTALTACSGNGPYNDPGNQPTTSGSQVDMKPAQGDHVAADTIGVDSLRNRSMDSTIDSTTAAPKR